MRMIVKTHKSCIFIIIDNEKAFDTALTKKCYGRFRKSLHSRKAGQCYL